MRGQLDTIGLHFFSVTPADDKRKVHRSGDTLSVVRASSWVDYLIVLDGLPVKVVRNLTTPFFP